MSYLQCATKVRLKVAPLPKLPTENFLHIAISFGEETVGEADLHFTGIVDQIGLIEPDNVVEIFHPGNVAKGGSRFNHMLQLFTQPFRCVVGFLNRRRDKFQPEFNGCPIEVLAPHLE